MSYDGRAVANFILDRCEERGLSISNLSLQKIAYFCHVWCLIELHRPLIKQPFEAWQYGPVLQYLYREFKDLEAQPIRRRATKLDPSSGRRLEVDYQFDAELQALLERVTDFYSRLRPGDLVDLSHAKGGPWESVWNHAGIANPGMSISDESIVEFYSKVRSPIVIQ